MRLPGGTALHMAGAFVLMGGWALWANRGAPGGAQVMAGVTQGVLSALLTAGLKSVVDRLVPRLGRLMAPALALAGSATLLVTAHMVAGTPALMATIAVPLAVSGTYVFAYATLSGRVR